MFRDDDMQLQKTHIEATELIPRWGCVTSLGELADSNTPAHQDHVVGITDGKMEANRWGDVTTAGLIFDMTWTWNPGAPIYLNGTVLSETPPGVGFVQQMGWALTAQSILVDVRSTGAGGVGPPGPPGPAGPAGPASVIIRDTWNPAPPADASVDTVCVFRDGTASRTWDSTAGAWI